MTTDTSTSTFATIDYDEGEAYVPEEHRADRARVEKLLERWVSDASEYMQEDGSYLVLWPTEYDEAGEMVSDDPVTDIEPDLPAGWSIGWTGNGNGDEEDFSVGFAR